MVNLNSPDYGAGFNLNFNNPVPADLSTNYNDGLSFPDVGTPDMSQVADSGGLFGADWEGLLSKDGVISNGLKLGTNLFKGWLGMKKLDLAKDAFRENKRQFRLNFDAQRRTTNASLRDRQRARLSANPNAYQSVDSYMQQNGVR